MKETPPGEMVMASVGVAVVQSAISIGGKLLFGVTTLALQARDAFVPIYSRK